MHRSPLQPTHLAARAPDPGDGSARLPVAEADAIAARAGGVLVIDLEAIARNYAMLAARVAPAECAGVVKADAYGLGLAPVARALARAGCRFFFVARLDEAIALRAHLPDQRIAVLDGVLPGTEADLVSHRLIPVLNGPGDVAAWQGHARASGIKLAAIVHLDTGINRLGFGPAEFAALAADPARLEGIEVQLWMSHLACADEPQHPLNAGQLARFQAALRLAPTAPASLASSSGIFLGPAYHFDVVRPGAALYGINPAPGAANPMRGVVELLGRVLQVRTVDAAETVGYGATHRLAREAKIATVAVGYGDGYMRSLSARGAVFVGGVTAPVIGRVSMDLLVVDVSAVPEPLVRRGGFVEIIGPHRSLDDVAREAGTIGYEILTGLGGRYHRLYRSPGDPATAETVSTAEGAWRS